MAIIPAIDRKVARELPEPTTEWCFPLQTSLGDREGAPRPGHFGTPERFQRWLERIWQYRVDRERFAVTDFTPDCLLIDPFGRLKGAQRCWTYFQLLFLLFPDLSGKYLTWAANPNSIVVNWGFLTTNGAKRIFVPSLDIYGFKDGRVNYHLAAFDRVALANALDHAYPDRFPRQFGETLQQRLWHWHADEEFADREYARYTAG